MASISTLVDRVKIFVLSSGTGAFQLGAAVPAFRGIEALTDGSTYSYAVENGSSYEAGTGVYLAESGVLVRTPVLSSAGNAAVAFPAGVQIVFTALAQDLIATGGSLPIVDALGDSPVLAISQHAASVAIEAAMTAVASILNGESTFTLPDEANGDSIPATGSGLPYLSAGVLKIA